MIPLNFIVPVIPLSFLSAAFIVTGHTITGATVYLSGLTFLMWWTFR